MKCYPAAWAMGCVVAVSGLAWAGIGEEMQQASEALQPVMRDAPAMLAEGRVDEIDHKILATFPEESRTPVQALVLANVLFKHDPQTSYALHKRAAGELPDEADAQLEWAMEQHRAGQYAGAAESYARFAKSHPDFGPALGLWSECLIRTGRTAQSVETWDRSEKGSGSLEQFESWVCDVHTHGVPDRERAALIPKVGSGDVAAAERLVALDCDFARDWWNRGPQAKYLTKDLEIIRRARFADPKRVDQVECAAECGIIQADGAGDVKAVLRRHGLLFDERGTLPAGGRLISPMLSAALSSEAISKDEARAKWGPSIIALAKTTGEAEAFNAAAHLYVGTDRLAEIDQLGWDATGDPRFAASLLVGLSEKGLALNDPRLVKAQKQFPENAEIARIVVILTKRAGKPLQPALINAIKAEYSHFSAGGLLMARPKASALRAYFAELAKELRQTPAAG